MYVRVVFLCECVCPCVNSILVKRLAAGEAGSRAIC